MCALLFTIMIVTLTTCARCMASHNGLYILVYIIMVVVQVKDADSEMAGEV